MEEYRNSSNAGPGNSSEVAVEQSADFSTEIMNVTEMEQSPVGSPNVNATTEENEIANAVDLPVTETEANFPPDYEKFWKTVENNPQDFTGWVYLLQYVEQEVSNFLNGTKGTDLVKSYKTGPYFVIKDAFFIVFRLNSIALDIYIFSFKNNLMAFVCYRTSVLELKSNVCNNCACVCVCMSLYKMTE